MDYYQPQRSRQVKTSLPELANLNLPEEVNSKAHDFFKQIQTSQGRTYRDKNRRRGIYYCVYHAYQELGLIFDHVKLATDLGLSKDDISKARRFYHNDGDFQPPLVRKSPIDYIPIYYSYLDQNSHNLEIVLNFSRPFLQNRHLADMKPQYVAAGIVYYYADINGISFNLADYLRKVGMSDPTLQKFYNLISEVHAEL